VKIAEFDLFDRMSRPTVLLESFSAGERSGLDLQTFEALRRYQEATARGEIIEDEGPTKPAPMTEKQKPDADYDI
jgi:hypothetical protein